MYHGYCKFCGCEFTSDRKYMYCRAHKNATLRKQSLKPVCKQCGAELPPYKRTFCSAECLKRYHNPEQYVLTEDIVKARVAERYEHIEHVSGHTSNGTMLVRCKICGREFEIGERASRKTYNMSCAYHKEPIAKKERIKPTCEICGIIFDGRPNAKACSSDCAKERARRQSVRYGIERHNKEVKARKCKRCGITFTPEYGSKNRSFCSTDCCTRYSRKVAKITRRARKKNAFVSKVDYREIFERDRGICQLCGKPVNDKHKSPEPDSGTLDHIIPLALGGTHEPKNIQLAHFGCNSRKGTKAMGSQLRLC